MAIKIAISFRWNSEQRYQSPEKTSGVNAFLGPPFCAPAAKGGGPASSKHDQPLPDKALYNIAGQVAAGFVEVKTVGQPRFNVLKSVVTVAQFQNGGSRLVEEMDALLFRMIYHAAIFEVVDLQRRPPAWPQGRGWFYVHSLCRWHTLAPQSFRIVATGFRT